MMVNTISAAITKVLRFFAAPWIMPTSAAIARIIPNAILFHSFKLKSVWRMHHSWVSPLIAITKCFVNITVLCSYIDFTIKTTIIYIYQLGSLVVYYIS